MKKFVLNNGLEIPVTGFGTFPQKEILTQSAQIAFKTGYRLFDTSDNYLNEEYLGEAVKIIGCAMNEALIITKFSQPLRTGELKACFDESLSKLAGKIDILLLHWPYTFLWKTQWRIMEQLYLEGRVRAIGVCNFEVDKLKSLLRFCKVKPTINQIERHPLFQQNEIVDFCMENDIQVMSYAPIARRDTELMSSPVLAGIAAKYGKTPAQIILRWDIDTGTVPIPASQSPEHIAENHDIFDFSLTDSEIKEINAMERGKRIRFDPKTRFTRREILRFLKKRVKLFI